jgi:hypothetical protein
MDVQAQHVQVYTPEGEYLRTVGGQGAGPGELTGAIFLVMGPGDTLMVPDVNNRRINLFGPDGSSIGSFPLALEQGIPLNFRYTPSGVIAEQVRPLDLPNMPTTDSLDTILLLATDGTVTDTLKRFPSGETFSFSRGLPEFKFYSPEASWALSDDAQLIFGINDQYRIDFYADGELDRVVTLPFEQRLVGDRDKQLVAEYLERTWTESGVPPQILEQLKNNVHFGEYFPAFANILPGPDGSIWVQHIQAASDLSEEELESFDLLQDSGAPEWDVFDSEGRYLGVVTMPYRFSPRIIYDDYIYGVSRDELDVQYLVRMRIVTAT